MDVQIPVKIDSSTYLFDCVRTHCAPRWTKLSELEAEVGRTEALYAAVTEEARVAEEEGSSLTAVRTRLEREMVQIGTRGSPDAPFALVALDSYN